MKKFLFAIAAAAMMFAGCTKDGNGGNDGMPSVASITVEAQVSASAKTAEGFNITFSGKDFDGRDFSTSVARAMDGTLVLCDRENPKLSEDETANVFEIAFQAAPVPGFVAADGDNFQFSYELLVKAYDSKGKVISSSWFRKFSAGGTGKDGYTQATASFGRESFSAERRGVWISKTGSGEWQVGADKL